MTAETQPLGFGKADVQSLMRQAEKIGAYTKVHIRQVLSEHRLDTLSNGHTLPLKLLVGGRRLVRLYLPADKPTYWLRLQLWSCLLRMRSVDESVRFVHLVPDVDIYLSLDQSWCEHENIDLGALVWLTHMVVSLRGRVPQDYVGLIPGHGEPLDARLRK